MMKVIRRLPKWLFNIAIIVVLLTIITLLIIMVNIFVSSKTTTYLINGEKFGRIVASNTENISSSLWKIEKNIGYSDCISMSESVLKKNNYNIQRKENEIQGKKQDSIVNIYCPVKKTTSGIYISSLSSSKEKLRLNNFEIKELFNYKLQSKKYKKNTISPLMLKNTNKIINTNDLNTCLKIISNELNKKGISFEKNIEKRSILAETNNVLFSAHCVENVDYTQTINIAVSGTKNSVSYYTESLWVKIVSSISEYNKNNKNNNGPRLSIGYVGTKYTKKNECLNVIKKAIKNVPSIEVIEIDKAYMAIISKSDEEFIYSICENFTTKFYIIIMVASPKYSFVKSSSFESLKEELIKLNK